MTCLEIKYAIVIIIIIVYIEIFKKTLNGQLYYFSFVEMAFLKIFQKKVNLRKTFVWQVVRL